MTKSEHKLLGKILGGRDALPFVIAWWKSKAPKRKPESSYRVAKKAKALSRRGARSDVRAACVARANGLCECLRVPTVDPLEMDHFYGRARSESVETCWMLSRGCRKHKTENKPSRAFWDGLFRRHCEKHGYEFRPRLCKERSAAGPLKERSDP